jgi:hypothetical protein
MMAFLSHFSKKDEVSRTDTSPLGLGLVQGAKLPPPLLSPSLTHTFHQSPATRSSRKPRSLTPKKVKKQSVAWIIDDTDTEGNDSLTDSTIAKELNRMERRNDARDVNRPDLNAIESAEDSEWTSEEGAEKDEGKKKSAGVLTKLNDSFRRMKLYEEYMKRQQKRRSKNFAVNRS